MNLFMVSSKERIGTFIVCMNGDAANAINGDAVNAINGDAANAINVCVFFLLDHG